MLARRIDTLTLTLYASRAYATGTMRVHRF
jgi:hypothetical protein